MNPEQIIVKGNFEFRAEYCRCKIDHIIAAVPDLLVEMAVVYSDF